MIIKLVLFVALVAAWTESAKQGAKQGAKDSDAQPEEKLRFHSTLRHNEYQKCMKEVFPEGVPKKKQRCPNGPTRVCAKKGEYYATWAIGCYPYKFYECLMNLGELKHFPKLEVVEDRMCKIKFKPTYINITRSLR